jgi:hypothetical protein
MDVTLMKPMDGRDYDSYCQSMARNVAEKAWFIPLLPDHVIGSCIFVDIGCADAPLIDEVELFGIYLGYDNDPEMLQRAGKRGADAVGNLSFLAKKIADLRKEYPHVVLVMNSVLHEMYSYGSCEDNGRFWLTVRDIAPNFVAVRDMGMTKEDFNVSPESWVGECSFNLYRNLPMLRTGLYDRKSCNHYLRHSRAGHALQLLHFNHDESEWKEDYFSCSPRFVMDRFTKHRIHTFERFTPPYVRARLEEIAGHPLWDTCTHYKLFMEQA